MTFAPGTALSAPPLSLPGSLLFSHHCSCRLLLLVTRSDSDFTPPSPVGSALGIPSWMPAPPVSLAQRSSFLPLGSRVDSLYFFSFFPWTLFRFDGKGGTAAPLFSRPFMKHQVFPQGFSFTQGNLACSLLLVLGCCGFTSDRGRLGKVKQSVDAQ